MSRSSSRLVKTSQGGRSTIARAAGIALGLLAALSAGPGLAQAAPLPVHTEQGWLQGRHASGVDQYLGVPYAQPPVGPMRWRPPQPAVPWSGTRDATRFGASCPQYPGLFAEASTNEDCLSLNIYAPPSAVGGQGPRAPRPVIVWVHGGAFQVGAGQQYDGSTMALKTNAIVITVNYRLGAFGFLATSGMAGEGRALNFGLQDQWMALRWVKRNIAAFGGDASRVTLAGQSSGGTSGCLALASPAAQGLFDRVIMHSASCGLAAKPLEAARAYGDALATRAGCPAGPTQMACLRGKPVEALLAVSPTYEDSVTKFDIWSATVDGTTLPLAPLEAMALGRVQRVPVMLGANRDEGRGFILPLFHLGYGRVMTQADYDGVAGHLLGTRAPRYTSLYSAANYGSVDLAASSLITDKVFSCVASRMAAALSLRMPTYAFEFADRTAPQFAPDPFIAWGAFHGAELLYLFQSQVAGIPQPPLDPAQQALGDQMLRYWKGFVASGNPNVASTSTPGPIPRWPRFDPLTAPFQTLQTAGAQPRRFGAFEGEHRCRAWALEPLF